MTSIKIWVLLFALQLLLQQSGDVELNPGPGPFHKDELHGYSEGTEEEGKHGVWYMGRRREEEENAAFVIQGYWRGYLSMQRARAAYLKLKHLKTHSAVKLQSWWRMISQRKKYLAELFQQTQAAILLQAQIRGLLERRWYQRLREAVIVVQRKVKQSKNTEDQLDIEAPESRSAIESGSEENLEDETEGTEMPRPEEQSHQQCYRVEPSKRKKPSYVDPIWKSIWKWISKKVLGRRSTEVECGGWEEHPPEQLRHTSQRQGNQF